MNSQFGAILLSRVELRPSGRSTWLLQTKEALAWLESNQMGVISSVGQPTWEMVTALASKARLPMKLLLPLREGELFEHEVNRVSEQFDLDPELVEFLPHWITQPKSEKERIFGERDRRLIDQADLLLPIAIRSGGSLARLIPRASEMGKSVENRFAIEYDSVRSPLGYSLQEVMLNPELSGAAEQYLTHWTRSRNSRWPDERLIDYYLAITDSPRYPRSAKDTLEHIIQTDRVLASERHMPDRVASVSFSAADPKELVSLMRWRSRYRQMSFEPYGLGIDRDLAHDLGIKQVRYFDPGSPDQSDLAESWLRQSQGKVSDWRTEQEYRHRGDLDLSKLSREKLVLFCLLPLEAERLAEKYDLKVIPFLP